MKLHTRILLGMTVGVLGGLLIGPTGFLMPRDGVELLGETPVLRASPSETSAPVPLSSGLRRGGVLDARDGAIEVEMTLRSRDLLRARAAEVDGADRASPGDRVRGFITDDPSEVRRFSLLGEQLVAWTEWIGRLFLRMIQMVVVPLVFLSLVVGIASLGDVRALGRLGGLTLGAFLTTTLIALGWGLALANLFRPGDWLRPEDRDLLLRSFGDEVHLSIGKAAGAPSLTDQIVHIVPSNPIEAMATGDMLPILFFATMLGAALTMLPDRRADLVIDVFDRLNDAIVVLVRIAMELAPFGVAALLFKVAGTTGPSVLFALGAYCGVVVLGLALHLGLTYGAALGLLARLPLHRFLSAMREALLLAFSTSSSSATLPVTKACVDRRVGVPSRISSFVLPLGATVNMDGTALYQAVAAVFIAQIYGVPLDLTAQIVIVGSATLASVGAAGVPGAGMITLVMVLTAAGIPTEGLALILGVDRILDMFRTIVNVVGDASVTTIVARFQGAVLDLDPKRSLSDAEA